MGPATSDTNFSGGVQRNDSKEWLPAHYRHVEEEKNFLETLTGLSIWYSITFSRMALVYAVGYSRMMSDTVLRTRMISIDLYGSVGMPHIGWSLRGHYPSGSRHAPRWQGVRSQYANVSKKIALKIMIISTDLSQLSIIAFLHFTRVYTKEATRALLSQNRYLRQNQYSQSMVSKCHGSLTWVVEWHDFYLSMPWTNFRPLQDPPKNCEEETWWRFIWMGLRLHGFLHFTMIKPLRNSAPGLDPW